jgi:adenosyl cobinamide kinase/adenosyl cobinamide phosphate guanylyltransferase
MGNSNENKLEDSTENSAKENEKQNKPKQLIFISDDTGKSIVPLPRLGHISEQPPKEDSVAYAK